MAVWKKQNFPKSMGTALLFSLKLIKWKKMSRGFAALERRKYVEIKGRR